MNPTDWSTTQLAVLYAVALVVLGVLDGVWLGWLARDFYRTGMGALMADSPRWIPAAIFYLAYPIGLVWFALLPLSAGDASVGHAFLRSAALGLLAYGTYDLTNLSVVRGFSVRLAIVDMAWGTVVSGVAGAAALAAVKWWVPRN